MMNQGRTWDRRSARRRTLPIRRPRVRVPSISLPLQGINPLRWLRAWPQFAALLLLCLAAVVYLVQVNQGSWLESKLMEQGQRQTLLNAKRAELLARLYKASSAQHISAVASTRLHMTKEQLTAAVWLRVSVPPNRPHVPTAQSQSSGPLAWMAHSLSAIGDSL